MDAFTLVAKLVLNRDEFDRDLAGVESDMGSDSKLAGFKQVGAKIGRIAAQAAQAAFNAIADFGRSAIEKGMDFDYMMSKVKAVTGMTDEQFETVRKRAMELGESTEWTAEQVGQAFYYMGVAGWKSGEMLDGIEPILNLASASGEDLGQTADIVTDALTAMGYQAKDAAQFANVLAAAANNSNTTVGMLGEAFKYLATTGGVMEYSIEDVATTLGLLANNGIKASQAGTAMRQILNTLINPSDQAAEAMKNLGLSLFDPKTDKRKPLFQVIEEMRQIFKEAGLQLEEGFDADELQNRLDRLNEWYDKENEKIEQMSSGQKKARTELEKNYKKRFIEEITPNEAFLKKVGTIGGLRGISSLLALMKSTDDDVNQLQEAVNKSSEGKGAAKTTAEIMLDNLKGDITLLNSALDGLKILVSDEYNEKIRKFVQEITGGIGDISAAFKEGGASEAFASLTDWIINGITKTLTDPNITVKGANEFGKALGDFVGHLVASLIDNAPELMGGLFEAGASLAGGLIQGLFSGLFGTGAGTVYGAMQQAGENRDEIIDEANKTAAEATGIVNYMDSLVQKYGEAASESAEWASAMERLKQLIPDITSSIKEEGQELGITTQNFREYIEQSRQKAIEDAKKAYAGDLQKKYEEQLISLGEAEIKRDLAKETQEEIVAELANAYIQRKNYLLEQGKSYYTDIEDELTQTGEGYASAEEVIKAFREGEMTLDQLTQLATTYADLIGGNEENLEAFGNTANTMRDLNVLYENAQKEITTQNENINQINQALPELKTSLDIAVKAVERMAQKADSFDVPSVDGYGQAKGDWYVPYDNYPSLLHRGEMVLTASQARRYREGDGNMNTEAFAAAVVSAIRQGMENAQVNAYMDGRKVSEEVSRNLNDLLMEGRYA